MKKLLYLDYASTTPQSDASVRAMQPFFQQDFYNPSALYLAAKNIKSNLDTFRAAMADVLQVRPGEIYFTAGSTEANNTVVYGMLNQYSDSHILLSAIEHDSVINLAGKFNHSLIAVNTDGIIDLASAEKAITDKTALVSCMLANNEIGTVQPVAELAKIIAKIKNERLRKGNKRPLYLHVDASQSFNYLNLLPHQLNIDFAVVGGSKIYGPKQVALLFIKSGISLDPLIVGGGQERGMRSGTENVAGIAGFTAAMLETDSIRSKEVKRLLELRSKLVEGIFKIQPSAVINGSVKHRLPNNVHVTFNEIDNEKLVMQLDEQGIMIATGSACSASSDEPSHVLKAIGLTDKQARSSVRITTGRHTSTEDINRLITVLGTILHR